MSEMLEQMADQIRELAARVQELETRERPNQITDTTSGVTFDSVNVGSATGAATGAARASVGFEARVDGSGGGVYAGASSDVQFYRSAADTWRTPDSLTVDGGLTAAGVITANNAGLRVQMQNAGLYHQESTLANGGTLSLGGHRGLILIENATDDYVGLYIVSGGGGNYATIANLPGAFVNVGADAGTQFALYFSSGWVLKNRYATSKVTRVQYWGA
jgi:hypothetical protein